MKCTHKIIQGDSRKKLPIEIASVDLVVTSPPYPMIKMWDEIFSRQNEKIKTALENGDGAKAFDLMHKELRKVWKNISLVVKEGGMVCINIGDATRTVNGEFKLYSNHSRIISEFLKLGFSNLPNILWRKPTNSPNKFMGSGMLPPGAYVTLEHEYILLFRKGGKREFTEKPGKDNRNLSTYFWEERNLWFSDVWDFKGTSQKMTNGVRDRSGAYPFELAYRLLNMFSVKGDTILDPFVGLGTTTLAAIASERNSIGIELEKELINDFYNDLNRDLQTKLNYYIKKRIKKHIHFIETVKNKKGQESFKYENNNFKFPVMTRQELNVYIKYIKRIYKEGNKICSDYFDDAIIDLQYDLTLLQEL